MVGRVPRSENMTTTCALTGSNYTLVDMCTVINVLSDLSVFINDAFSPLITLMVMVMVLGGVISIVGAILYTIFRGIQGGFGGWKG